MFYNKLHTIEKRELVSNIQVKNYIKKKAQSDKMMKFKKEQISDVGNSVTNSNIQLIKVPEGEKEKLKE